MKTITIQSFFGIGDLLFVTPTLRRIKEAYPDLKVVVNTSRPGLLKDNPFVDEIGSKPEGVKLMYTAPDTGRLPTEHHIMEDWRIVCEAYDLKTEPPELKPELYVKYLAPARNYFGVQIQHKRLYHNKRVWPGFDRLARRAGFEPIPDITGYDAMEELVRQISSYRLVVCAEGGVSHIAAALGMPAIVLFGGFSDPNWTGYSFHINIISPVSCRHCYNHLPCKNDFMCWDEISTKRVEDIARNYDAYYRGEIDWRQTEGAELRPSEPSEAVGYTHSDRQPARR